MTATERLAAENDIVDPVDRLLTADEVGELLRVDKTTIYRLARKRLIPAVPIGRYWRFRRESIEAWIVEQDRPAR